MSLCIQVQPQTQDRTKSVRSCSFQPQFSFFICPDKQVKLFSIILETPVYVTIKLGGF